MKMFRFILEAGIFLATLATCRADPAPIIHYAPAENLEHVDVALIDRAEHEIDVAAYVLTDRPIMQALMASINFRRNSASSTTCFRSLSGA